MWSRVAEAAFANPTGAGLVILCLAALLLAAAIYKRAQRARNGNGHTQGDGLAEYVKDLEGIGPPKPPHQRGKPFVLPRAEAPPPVAREVFDIALEDVGRRITQVSAEGTELRERMVVVEQTCKRTESDVKALPETFKALLEAQTVQLEKSNARHILAAFVALDKQTDERFEALRKELLPPQRTDEKT